MSYFLGFDVAKSKLDWSLVNEQGIEQTYGKVANEEVAIATLLFTIGGQYPGENITGVAEATGGHQDILTETAYAIGIGCLVYNPILTKQGIKGTVRGKKTDRTDALMIARLGLRGEGRLYTPEPYKPTKYLARSCQKLTSLAISFKRHNNHMARLLEDGLSDAAQQLVQAIQAAITAGRKQLYQDLADSAQGETFRLLQTITGIGPYVAASILGEIQDMRRFPSSKAVTAFAGLDPKIRQSGKTLNSTGRLTKRGSSYLRRSLFIAANAARRYDPQFKALYDKKRSEGKSYKVATCVVARKLLKVVRSVWLSGQDYKIPEEYRQL